MAEMDLSYADLLEIVRIFEASDTFRELRLKWGDAELDLRKNGAASHMDAIEPVVQPLSAPPPRAMEADAEAQTRAQSETQAAAAGAHLVKSPMVGTFYAASEPGAPPFVSVGQRVCATDTVCIIEVMKLMNSMEAGVDGVVREILVGDGDAVQFGQPLLSIVPDRATREG
jgi:acetyl-CoA carboxylase biotin carboxyl carrier protein